MSAPPQQPSTQPHGDAYDWFVRGRALYEDGSAAAAAELLGRALAAEPEARSIREALARALFDSGHYLQALTEFEKLVAQAPDDHYAHFGAGLASWRLSRLTSAAEHLAIAVAMRPHRTEYRRARDQVRATIQARVDAGLPLQGPIVATGPITATGDDPPPPPLAEPTGPTSAALDDAGPNRRSPAQAAVSTSPAASEAADVGPTAGAPAAQAEPDGMTASVLARTHDVVLLDLDGVVYRGSSAVPHAVQSIRAAAAQGLRVAYVTNNASRTAADVAAKLTDLGLQLDADDVVTSAQAGAALLRERVPAAARVLAVGGAGVPTALTAAGLTPVRPHELSMAAAEGPAGAAVGVAAVLMGYGPDVGWTDLAEASYAVAAGAVFVASNTDLTLPTERGVAPGNGTLVAAVVTATGVTPVVAGKPFSPLLEQSIGRTGAKLPLVVGDRLDTDIEAAARLGLPSLLVMTGVTDVPALLTARVEHRPTYLAADLRGLLARGRRVRPSAVGQVTASGELSLGDLDDATLGADPLQRLRAAAAACWDSADRGRPASWPDAVLGVLVSDLDRGLANG